MERYGNFSSGSPEVVTANWGIGKYWISNEFNIWVHDSTMERLHDYTYAQEFIVDSVYGKGTSKNAGEDEWFDLLDSAIESCDFYEYAVSPLAVVVYTEWNDYEWSAGNVIVLVTDTDVEEYRSHNVMEYTTFSSDGKYDSAIAWAKGKGLDSARKIAQKTNDEMVDGETIDSIVLLDDLQINGDYDSDYEANVVMIEQL